MSRRQVVVLLTGLMVTGLLIIAGCGGGGGGGGGVGYNPKIDPADFPTSTTIDNQYMPLVPGTIYTYNTATETVIVDVTYGTKVIQGITCVVVHDYVAPGPGPGGLLEDTWDWYAQDEDGNVWYFGEDTEKYEDDGSGGYITSTEGSWEAGVAGAKPGMVMLADPQYGDKYRQEYLEDEAEDWAEVIGVDESVVLTVGPAAGTYLHCVETKDWSALEPDVIEHKYWAPGVGLVRTLVVAGDPEDEVLIDITTY